MPGIKTRSQTRAQLIMEGGFADGSEFVDSLENDPRENSDQANDAVTKSPEHVGNKASNPSTLSSNGPKTSREESVKSIPKESDLSFSSDGLSECEESGRMEFQSPPRPKRMFKFTKCPDLNKARGDMENAFPAGESGLSESARSGGNVVKGEVSEKTSRSAGATTRVRQPKMVQQSIHTALAAMCRKPATSALWTETKKPATTALGAETKKPTYALAVAPQPKKPATAALGAGVKKLATARHQKTTRQDRIKLSPKRFKIGKEEETGEWAAVKIKEEPKSEGEEVKNPDKPDSDVDDVSECSYRSEEF